MDEANSEPPLSHEDTQEIAFRQFEIDNAFTKKLNPLRYVRPIIDPSIKSMLHLATMISGGKPPEAPGPTMPPSPSVLHRRLAEYGKELLACEYEFYPRVPESAIWLRALGSRIERRVIERVKQIGELDYHATYGEMGLELRKALEVHVKSEINALIVPIPPPATTRSADPIIEEFQDAQSAFGQGGSIKGKAATEPKTIVAAYFAKFPEKIKIIDVCWAAAQYYREWKRWIGGSCKPGSTPDKAFRAILTSGKRPLEYRSEPRPPKWGYS